ncbi:hypothetical protein PYW07_013018 [Mythimna separata]|uniref:Uncharacterized protein n=1 Tax=Mythimna separata TaxID=271217 RepID=A0AAD7Y5P9_MYTSE|nr:hypothetical protein PYW07_013018 [Mythimna separata]
MQISEIKDTVTDCDEDDPNPLADALRNEQKSDRSKAVISDHDISITIEVSNLRETGETMFIPIPADFLNFTTGLLYKLEDELLDVTEPDLCIFRYPSDISTTSAIVAADVALSPSTNNMPTLSSSSSEQAELKEIGYYDTLRDISVLTAQSAFTAEDIACPPEDVSASFSHSHSKVEDKIKLVSFATSTSNSILKAENDAKVTQEAITNTEVSIPANEIGGDMDAKKMEPTPSIDRNTDTSDESMFYITADSELSSLTDGEMDNDKENAIMYNEMKILQLEKDLEAVNEHNNYMKVATSVEKVGCSNLNDFNEKDNKTAGDNLNTLFNLTDDKCSGVGKVKDNEEHKLSFDENRQVVALIRKESLNNIANAQTALQKSKLALDNRDPPKVLPFDNESISEEILQEHFPLKERAFGNSSPNDLNISEPKETTVSMYLNTVSKESIEQVAESVVNDKSVTMKPSLHCTTTQASLATNIHASLASELSSGLNIHTQRQGSMPKFSSDQSCYLASTRESVPRQSSFSEILTEYHDAESKPMLLHTHVTEHPSIPEDLLVFDQLNPLNNVVLRPNNFMEVHKYDPVKPADKVLNSECTRYVGKHYNRACRVGNTEDFEVRAITIQQQRFSQEANQRTRHYNSDSDTSEELTAATESTNLSEDSLQDESSLIIIKTKKQIGRPSTGKHKHHGSLDVTPKEQQKTFLKRNRGLTSLDKIKDYPVSAKVEKQNYNRNGNTSKDRDKESPKTKMRQPDQNSSVGQFIADCIGFDTTTMHNNDFEENFDGVNCKLNAESQIFTPYTQSVLSFSSSKNFSPMRKDCVSLHQPTIQSTPLEDDWQPKLVSSKMLIFDYQKSLNNVLCPTFYVTEAHKYNPMKYVETLYCAEHSAPKEKYYSQMKKDFERQAETIKQHVGVKHTCLTQEDNQRMRSSRLHSADLEKQATFINNTSNKLLQVSAHDSFSSNSHVNVTKNKRRTCSPTKGKHRRPNCAKVTPKPVTVKQKISTKPKVKIKVPNKSTFSLELQKDDEESSQAPKARNTKAHDNKSVKSNMLKPKRSVLKVQYSNLDTGFKRDDYCKNILKGLNSKNPSSENCTVTSESDVTFTLDKNSIPTRDHISPLNPDCQALDLIDSVAWPPELMCATFTNTNESYSGANVVARINMLSFMGSHECEWEASPADTWSFRLLHAQLRLTARLAHRVDNATRTRVRGDTPVLDIAVKIVHNDRTNIVAKMCLRYACETMSHIVSRATRTRCCASDIPPLLHRCANIVRVALRWKRAMQDAKRRLAYTLDSCGNLSLKVANIPLRSVWAVTMRVELVVDDRSLVAYPRASHVGVVPVVSDVLVPALDVRRALATTPNDWGHVPGTIWRVHKLLKNKKEGDSCLR